jgi:hypothetical protein
MSQKSANDSFLYEDGHLKQAKHSLFSHEDLFKEENPGFQAEPNPLGVIDFGSNISLADMSCGRPGGNSNLVSPKLLSVAEKIFDSEPIPPSKGHSGSSTSQKQKTYLNKKASLAAETQNSGSLNIKELSSASDSAKKKFVNQYSNIGNHLSQPKFDTQRLGGPEIHKTEPNYQINSSKGINFADVFISPNTMDVEKLSSRLSGTHYEPENSRNQNHFVKPASNVMDSKSFGVNFPNFHSIDERLLSSDGFQEKEFNINFQRDPDSVPGTARKLNERLTDFSYKKTEEESNSRPSMILKGKGQGISSETLLRIEQKYNNGNKIGQNDQKTLTHYRKDSVGKKLKEALVNLKCKGAINQPFRKKTEFMYLKASKDSQKGSRNNSLQKADGRKASSKPRNAQEIQKPSVLSTLSSMILRSRKGSFGQTSSREASVKSKDSASNNSKAAHQDKSLSSGSRILNLLNQNSSGRTETRSASQKSSKRKNLLEFQSRVQEFNASKNDSRKDLQTGQESVVHLATKKMTSSSTKRLFEKIFSKDNVKQGRSIEQQRTNNMMENSLPSKGVVSFTNHSQGHQPNLKTENKKNLELDSLINKMYQASSQRSERYVEPRPDKSQASQDSKGHSKEQSLFTSKRSLLLENIQLTRSLEKSAAQARRSREGTLASNLIPEMSINEVQKLSLMSSRTNPDKGFGLLNFSDLNSNQGTFSRNQFLKSKEQPSSARTEAQRKPGKVDNELAFVTETDLVIHRKVLFGNGKGKNENSKSGLLKDQGNPEPLPRSATQTGLVIPTNGQRNLFTKGQAVSDITTRATHSPLQISNKKKIDVREFQHSKPDQEQIVKQDTRSKSKREVTPTRDQQQKPTNGKLKLLNDFITSFEERFKESEQV